MKLFCLNQFSFEREIFSSFRFFCFCVPLLILLWGFSIFQLFCWFFFLFILIAYVYLCVVTLFLFDLLFICYCGWMNRASETHRYSHSNTQLSLGILFSLVQINTMCTLHITKKSVFFFFIKYYFSLVEYGWW